MYRSQGLAAAIQVDALKQDLAALGTRLADAERARADAIAALERIRDGVEVDPDLETEPAYRRLLGGLRGIGVLAGAVLALGLVPLLGRVIADPLLTAQGARNLAFHLTQGHGLVGLAAAGFVVMVASPWIVIPLLAARGLARHRRIGWTLGGIACALYLPTPLLPLAVAGLVLLHSKRVRGAYLAR